MPEGPEAHTMADFLREILVGKHILKIEILDDRHAKSLECLPLPCLITNVTAIGKRPLIETNKGLYLLTFLCMNGRWLLKREKNARIVFSIGTCDYTHEIITAYFESEIYFDDERSQGCAFVECLNEYGVLNYKLSVRPDLITSPCTLNEFIHIARNKFNQETTVDVFLLSPKSNSTVGNYLKSEILYHARLSPYRTLRSCSDFDIRIMFELAIAISVASYKSQGFTMKHHLKPDGTGGYFSCIVYNREGQVDPNGYLIRRTNENGRSTYWVPQLQI